METWLKSLIVSSAPAQFAHSEWTVTHLPTVGCQSGSALSMSSTEKSRESINIEREREGKKRESEIETEKERDSYGNNPGLTATSYYHCTSQTV